MIPALLDTVALFRDHREDALMKSTELQHRHESYASKLRSDLAEIGASGKQGKPSRLLRAVQESAFTLFKWTDALTSTIVWEGAYRQALAEKKSEAAAVEAADDVIRSTFPAAATAEQPAILRDKRAMGAILTFFGFFSKMGNLTASIWRDKSPAEALGRTLALLVVLGPVSEILSGRGPDDDEEWVEWLIRKMLASPGGMVPVAGFMVEPLAGAATSAAFGKDVKLRAPSARAAPMASTLEGIGKLAYKVAGEKDGEAQFWALIEALALGLKLPVSQPRRTLSHLRAVMEGEETLSPGGIIYGAEKR
jgi:hypothetical protein